MAKKNRNRNRDPQNRREDSIGGSSGATPIEGAGQSAGGGGDDEGPDGTLDAAAEGAQATGAEADAPSHARFAVSTVTADQSAREHGDGETAAAGPSTEPLASHAGAADVIPFPSHAHRAPTPPEPTSGLPEALHPLLDKLRSGRCVLWAGSALEAQAGGPGFVGALARLLDEVPPGAATDEARRSLRQRPLLVASYVRRQLGAGFAAALSRAASSPSQLPEALRALGELPFRAVITSGYTDLLTRAFTRGETTPTVYSPGDAAALRKDTRGRYVLRALGDPQHAGTALFSEPDFQAALTDGNLAAAISDLYQNRTILFLGIDPAVDLEVLFPWLLRGAPSDGVEHYAVVPGVSALEREELERAFHMRVVSHDDVLAVAQALRDSMGDLTEALPDDEDLEGWLVLLQAEPGRPDALDKIAALEERLRAREDHERILELHLGMTEVEATPSGRASRLHQVANLFEHVFADQAKAFTALLAGYKEDPEADGPNVQAQLERLAEATGSWGDLLTEYSQVVPSLAPAVRGDQWVRIARLYGDKIGHVEYALHALDEAQKLDSGNPGIAQQRLSAFRKGERWKDVVEQITKVAEREESLSKKSELFLEQGDIYETRLDEPDAAVRSYHAALEADAGSTDALHALELLHRRRNEYPELVAILDEKLKSAPADRAAEMRREVATILADKLSDRKGAISRWEALRNEDPQDLAALRALERLYDLEHRTDDYLDVLSAQADAVADAADKASIYRRLAAEWEDRPEGPARAAEYLEKLLFHTPKSEEALRHVERLYAAQKKWEALVDAYRRHLDVPGADTVALQVSIARTYEIEINDPLRAADAWNALLKQSPSHDEALAALGRIHERTGDHVRALELYDQRANLARDAKNDAQRVQILFESGKLAFEKMGDTKEAETRLNKALEIDPQHLPSITTLVELYRKSGDFLRAAKLLAEAEGLTTNRLEKTRLLVEAGELYDSVDRSEEAITYYTKALAVDPEHVEAGGRVSELLWKANRHAELMPILEMLTRKEADRGTQKTRWLRLGKVARQLGQLEKSARAYSKAAELDPTDFESQSARGELLYADGKWSEARDAFAAVLGHHRESLTDPQLVELFYKLGECDRQVGSLVKAKNFYAKALEIDPTHRPTILAQIDVEGDDPRRIIESKRALLATASEDEKVKLLTEIGDQSMDKLQDPIMAVGAYRDALAIRPDSRGLLHKCLDVYVDQKDWVQALDILSRLTDLEKSPTVRAKLRFTRAIIHLEELSDTEAAIKLLGEAMDDDPAATRAAEKLEELLVQTESWKELTRLFRKQIKRMPVDAEADTPEMRQQRIKAWSAMADMLLEKLGETQSATAALEVLATLERGNAKRQEQLADLYVQAGPDQADKAIAAHQQLLKTQHDRINSYRALRQLYTVVNQPEKALAVAYALSFLRKGAPEDEALVAEAKKRPLAPARRNLDDDMWRQLAHADEDRLVGTLFGHLLPMVATASGKPHDKIPLSRKDKVETTDPRSFAKGMRYVAGVLNVTLPYECYVKYEQRDSISITNALDAKNAPVPCLIMGAPMLGDKRGERELVFELAKRLAYFRSDRYLRYVLQNAAQLGILIDAATTLGAEADRDKPAAAGPGPAEVQKIASDLKRSLAPNVLEQVILVGRKLKGQKAGTGGEQLAASWLTATELTATRAAFLLVGDLEQSARFVVAEPASVSTHPTPYRLKELIYFSITEECFTVRKHMGLLG